MDEKYIELLFKQLGAESKLGKYEDFKELISTDNDYRKQFYSSVGQKTLGEFNDFENLVSKKKDNLISGLSKVGTQVSSDGSQSTSSDKSTSVTPKSPQKEFNRQSLPGILKPAPKTSNKVAELKVEQDKSLYNVDPKKFETKLSPEKEIKFQQWLDTYAKQGKISKGDYDFYKKNGYGYDYDFRAAFEKGVKPEINKEDGRWHWNDIGKKPNEPTFSNQSKYHGINGMMGGTWDGDKFIAPTSPISELAKAGAQISDYNIPQPTQDDDFSSGGSVKGMFAPTQIETAINTAEVGNGVPVGAALAAGVSSVASSALKGIAIAAKRLDFFNEYDGKKVEDLATYKAGQWIDEKVKDIAGELTPEQQDMFAVKVIEGAGQIGGFMLGGWGGRVLKMSPFMTTAGLGAAVNGASEYEAAVQSGATPDQAAKAFWLNSLIGTTEALPIASAFRKLDRYTGGLATGMLAKKLSSTIGGRLTNEVAQGVFFETAQETMSQAFSNVVAANTYDKTRKVYDGLLETAAISSIIGGSMTGVASAIRERRNLGGLTKEEDHQLAVAQDFAEKKAEEALNPDKKEITSTTHDNPKVKSLLKAKTDIEADLSSSNLPEETKAKMQSEVSAINEQLKAAKTEVYQDDLNESQAALLQDEISKNESLLSDPNLTEGTKGIIQKSIDESKEKLHQLMPAEAIQPKKAENLVTSDESNPKGDVMMELPGDEATNEINKPKKTLVNETAKDRHSVEPAPPKVEDDTRTVQENVSEGSKQTNSAENGGSPEQPSQSRENDLNRTELNSERSIGRIPIEPIKPDANIKPKKLSDIVFDVSTSLKQKVSYSSPGRKRAIGSYAPYSAAIKIKYEGDLDVVSHEIGHSIDDRYGLLTVIEKDTEALKELQPFAQYGSKPPKNYPNVQKYINGEGFAEWLRALIVNPDKAKASAPLAFAHFEKIVPEDVRQKLESFSNDVRTWAGSSGRDQVLSNMEIEPPKKGSLLSKLFPAEDSNSFNVTGMDRLRANILNPLRVFDKAFNHAKGLKGIDEVLPQNDPQILSRLLLGVDGKIGEIYQTGMIDSQGNVLKDANGNAKTIKWLLEPLDSTDRKTMDNEMQDVIAYMAAERTLELAKRFDKQSQLSGIGAGIYTDVAVAKKALEEFNTGNPERLERIKGAASRYREYADDVLRYMVDKGRISKEQYNGIKENNLQYVAFQRIAESEPNSEIILFKQKSHSIGSQTKVIQEIRGSSKKISNPYTSLLETVHKSIKEADRNEVLKSFRDMVDSQRGMHEAKPIKFSDIAILGKAGDKNAITIFVKGKPEHWIFQDDIYKALKGLDGDVYKVHPILTAYARTLRWTVTHFPVFAARNWIKDFQSRIILSNENEGLSGFKNIAGDPEDWKTLARMGALNAGYYCKDKSHYYGLLKESMREVSDKGHIVIDHLKLKTWGKKYENLLYNSETSNRVAEYRSAFDNAKRKGYTDYNASLYAASKSRELIDFGVMGHWMKMINQLVPFSNASIQSLRSAAMKAQANPIGFAARVTLYSILPQVAMYYWNHRNEEEAKQYEDLPSYQRDMFWNFKIGANKWMSIPKPYELALPSGAVDRSMSYHIAGNKKAFNGYGGSVFKSLSPFDQGSVLGGAQAIGEVLFNKDFFRDKTIIPAYEEPLELALRHTERASRFGQFIQKHFSMDARYIDHFVKSQFSYFGNAAIKLSNIGNKEGTQHFDINDTGLMQRSPAYNSQPVQEMLEFAKTNALTSKKEYKLFNELAKEYFETEDNEQKEMLGDNLREFARNMLKDWQALKNDDKLHKKKRGK